MKIVHFSDTHLGYQAFDVVGDNGVNAREQDMYDAFERVIDYIVNHQPDLVIHTGDFFHRPSPSNRALTFGLEQLRRVSDMKIPFVVIAGNHETPKSVFTSPILRAFRSLNHVHPFFSETYETYEIGNVVVHGIPHINDPQALLHELDLLTPVANRFNILMLHTSVGKRYLMDEYGEQVFPLEFEEKLLEFQYVALGHWHNYQNTSVSPNAWYAGSTERMSDSEIGADKGFVLLDTHDDHRYTINFYTVPARPWHKLDLLHCHQKTISELMDEIGQFKSTHDTAESIVTLNMLDIKVEQSIELSNSRLRDLFDDCFQLLPKRKTWSSQFFSETLSSNPFESLDRQFAEYVRSKYPEDTETSAQIIERSKYYFDKKV